MRNELPSPPPVRRQRRVRIMLVAACTLVGLMLLVVLMRIDDAPAPDGANDPGTPVVDLIAPERLTDDERLSAGDDLEASPNLAMRRGGWIQVADKTDPGRVAQRYRFEALDPNPTGLGAGWARMERPIAEFSLSGDRILTMRGDEALVNMPSGALESGTITGNVLISIFDPIDGHPADPQTQTPGFVLLTEHAVFDSLSGEIICDSEMYAATNGIEFTGDGLSAYLNDQDDRVRLTIDHVDTIRFAQSPATLVAGPVADPVAGPVTGAGAAAPPA
ncbi:MAG: hypothetical protein KDA25_10040, partial [Phycisphaerales bacterium]|nr:hypothetical protein [Phycisphaerales bacterium]